MEEIWKPIDERYSVSNLGRVQSNYANKIRILKPSKNRCGYLMVNLRGSSFNKTVSVHRLVALRFIPNPLGFKEVNHKDENKANNCVDNLEWCDIKYNCNYGTRNIRKGLACRKKIFSVDVNGNISHYDSRNNAAACLGIGATSISKALSTKNCANKTAGNRLWFYDNESNLNFVKQNQIKAKLLTKPIYSVDKNGEILHYASTAEARALTSINNIARSLKYKTPAGGRYWFYE